jgi:hypothetical protein
MSALHSLTCFIFPLLPYNYPKVTAAFSLSLCFLPLLFRFLPLSTDYSVLSLNFLLLYLSLSAAVSIPSTPLYRSHCQSHFPVPLRRLSPHTTILSIPYPCLSLRLFFFPSPYIISRWLVAVMVRLERLVGDYMLLWDFEPYWVICMDVTRCWILWDSIVVHVDGVRLRL